MHYCLDKDQTHQMIDLVADRFILSKNPSELEILLYECINWERELTCLTYFVSRVLEVKNKQGDQPPALVKRLHSFLNLSEQIWLTFQEIDTEFIDYLYRHTKNEDLSLEDSLVQIQNWLNEHRYV